MWCDDDTCAPGRCRCRAALAPAAPPLAARSFIAFSFSADTAARFAAQNDSQCTAPTTMEKAAVARTPLYSCPSTRPAPPGCTACRVMCATTCTALSLSVWHRTLIVSTGYSIRICKWRAPPRCAHGRARHGQVMRARA
eukprot:355745-Chlamydomonas_euryale.AAC.3